MVNNHQHQLNACRVEEKTCLKLNEITSKNIKSVVIGTHASALPKKTLEEEPYTYVCQRRTLTVIELIKNFKWKDKRYKKDPWSLVRLIKIKKLVQIQVLKCLKI